MNPSASSPFRQAEERYFALRGQLDTGRITRAQFDEALAQLMLRDAQGRYWALGGDTGRWNVFQSGTWVEATPEGEAPPPMPPTTLPGARPIPPPVPAYAAPPAPVSPAPPRPAPASPPAPAPAQGGGGCGRTLGCSCLIVLLLLAICAGGAYWAYSTKAITSTTLLNLAGLGPARFEVDNFRDDAIDVTFQQVDVTKDATGVQGALHLNAFDVSAFHAPSAGRFRIDFVAAKSRTALGTCTISVRSGDDIQFVALPDKLLVNRANNPPSKGTELVVQSSTLCR